MQRTDWRKCVFDNEFISILVYVNVNVINDVT